MKKRIIGIDVARALAVIGMIFVNFKLVFGTEGQGWIKSMASIFDGKAAATFVVLAGVGIALMTNSALKKQDTLKLKKARTRIAKRALFLFVVGLSYIVIWPADILHFYGIYMLLTLLLLNAGNKPLLLSVFLLIFIYPLLMIGMNYETGWDFSTLTYLDFWTINGFIRNLFYNGFHPVIPWTAFMLLGLWFARQNLYDDRFIKKAFWSSLIVFVIIQLLSYASISLLSQGNQTATEELVAILGSSPMPPLPIYMLNGCSIAICMISACILLAKKFEQHPIIEALSKTGELALTFYVAHVIIGMGVVEAIAPGSLGSYTITFSFGYALIFSVACVLFAVIWTKFRTSGPLEWMMRKLTD